MSIALHIERLVLDGLGGYDPAQLQAAIEAELTRLLTDEGAAALPAQGLAIPTLAAPGIDTPAAGPRPLGAQIAGAIHAGLGTLGQPSSGDKRGAP